MKITNEDGVVTIELPNAKDFKIGEEIHIEIPAGQTWKIKKNPNASFIPPENTIPTENSLRCPDCGAFPGSWHTAGCDVERCSVCGKQAITCEDHYGKTHDPEISKWTGDWPR